MKAAVAALLGILMVLAWLLNAEVTTSRQLRVELADKSASDNLALQEKCALQAKKIFDDPYHKAEDRYKPGGSSQSYQSHYNAKLKKCFMTMWFADSQRNNESEYLLDAFEQREYANYSSYSFGIDKANPMAKSKSCDLMPSTPGKRECQSYEEYKAFVASYME